MSIVGDTGNGTTMVCGTSGFTANILELDLPEEVVQAIDAAYLGSTKAVKIPGDLVECGPIKGRYVFNPTAARPTLSSVETVTITLPKMISGSSAAATLAGTAFFTRRKLPNLQNNQLNVGEFEIQMNSDTGPTFTAEA